MARPGAGVMVRDSESEQAAATIRVISVILRLEKRVSGSHWQPPAARESERERLGEREPARLTRRRESRRLRLGLRVRLGDSERAAQA